MTTTPAPLRLGILGAARIAPAALIRPARAIADARVVAVAARDRDKAARFANKHGIDTVHGSYEALLADAGVDAIYNPLPNGLHGRWTRAALAAGKHVLCEKPFCANADEATEVAAAAAASGRVVMEAFHYRYHPLAARVREILDAHELGRLRHVETWLCFPLPRFSDIRYNHALAGGALMDAGCYAVHLARFLGGEEPEVVERRGQAAPTRRRPRHARRAALSQRPHRPGALLDVVVDPAAHLGAGRGRARRAAASPTR